MQPKMACWTRNPLTHGVSWNYPLPCTSETSFIYLEFALQLNRFVWLVDWRFLGPVVPFSSQAFFALELWKAKGHPLFLAIFGAAWQEIKGPHCCSSFSQRGQKTAVSLNRAKAMIKIVSSNQNHPCLFQDKNLGQLLHFSEHFGRDVLTFMLVLYLKWAAFNWGLCSEHSPQKNRR